jgi:phage-related protein
MPYRYESDLQELEAPSGLVWLAEVEVPTDPIKRFRITSNNEPLYFGESSEGRGNVYYSYPMKVGRLKRQTKADLPQISLTISNAQMILPDYLEQYDGLVGQKAVVQLVSLAQLENYTASLRFDGEIIGCEANPSQVSFSIGSYNPVGNKFPRERFSKEHCRYRVFGGPECGYPVENVNAAFSDCPRSYDACVERGDDEVTLGLDRQHPARFGGWRSMPGS